MHTQPTTSPVASAIPAKAVSFRGPSPATRQLSRRTIAAEDPAIGSSFRKPPLVATSTLAEDAREEHLVTVIPEMWQAHKNHNNLVKLSREQLSKHRAELASHLAEYKIRLIGTGRDGKWAIFLRELSIPLSTADRLVARHVSTLKDNNKLLIEELPELTNAQITAMVTKLVSVVKKKLNTEEATKLFTTQFIAGMSKAPPRLPPSHHKVSD